ncbi:MAG: pabB [Burkholderiaceae bacterium]|nr:pabB [Burkholderiaceae bacterium]
MTRPLTDLCALLFDSDESNAGCRLLQNAQRSWVIHAPSTPTHAREHAQQVEQLREDLHDIQASAQSGWFVVLNLSFEAYSAFSASEHLPLVDKPRADAALSTTPWLQAVAFKSSESMTRSEALSWLRAHSEAVSWHLDTAHAHTTLEQFECDVRDISERIADGQTYQVNLTHAYRTQLRAFSPNHPDHALYACFAHGVQDANIAYGGVCLFPETSVLSFSPELFFELDEHTLRTRPMKGTASVGQTSEETAQRAQTLANDPKNRAENLMIVDLMRNDVARLPQTTTVTVPDLFSVHAHGTVLQMTSTVQARLSEQPSLWQVFDALFPCGSITGAPKHETLKIIQSIEPYARGAYCGALGLIEQGASPDTYRARFNVAIRTLETSAVPTKDALGIHHWQIQGSVGAGITYDSVAVDEWDECVLKSQFFARHTSAFELIETMRVEKTSIAQAMLTLHHQRMKHSASTLGFVWSDAAFAQAIESACVPIQSDAGYRLRLSLSTAGVFQTQTTPLEKLPEVLDFAIYPERTHSQNPMLAHKTSMRQLYHRALAQAKSQNLFDCVFLNEKGEVTEGARSCIFVQLDGNWYTPPLSCGVLPSVQRAHTLNDASFHAQERVLTLDDLRCAQNIRLGNALYGLRPARWVAA